MDSNNTLGIAPRNELSLGLNIGAYQAKDPFNQNVGFSATYLRRIDNFDKIDWGVKGKFHFASKTKDYYTRDYTGEHTGYGQGMSLGPNVEYSSGLFQFDVDAQVGFEHFQTNPKDDFDSSGFLTYRDTGSNLVLPFVSANVFIKMPHVIGPIGIGIGIENKWMSNSRDFAYYALPTSQLIIDF